MQHQEIQLVVEGLWLKKIDLETQIPLFGKDAEKFRRQRPFESLADEAAKLLVQALRKFTREMCAQPAGNWMMLELPKSECP